MDTSMVLLILFVVIVAVFALMATGIHIIRPGEIGFIYRRGRFLRLVQPGLAIAIPIILRVHRMRTESLNIVVESSAHRAELQLGIADPSRVPITVDDMDSEIRDLASGVILKAPSLQDSNKNGKDQRDIAEDLKRRLDEAFKDMGLVVKSLRVGEYTVETHQNDMAAAGIPDWNDVSRRYGY